MQDIFPPDFETVELTGGQVIVAHPPSWCEDDDACAVHKPSDHHMKDWPQNFRDPRIEAATFGIHPGLMERICPHGVGHPDPDHMAFYAKRHTPEETSAEATHGCDGCCDPGRQTARTVKTNSSRLKRWLPFLRRN